MISTPAADTLALLDMPATRTGESGGNTGPRPGRFGGSGHGISQAGRVVANWHDQQHPGAFSTCTEQPCHAVREVDQ